MANSNALILNFLKKTVPNWPKLVNKIGEGQNGRVYKMNNGHLLKFVYGNAQGEVNVMKKLNNTGIAPKVWNSRVVNVNNATSRQLRNAAFEKKNLANKISLIMMNDIKVYSDRKNPRGKIMTLHKYYREYDTNNANITNRVGKLISAMHGRGVFHRNLHRGNIMVSVDDAGKITGMWVIDFGRSKIRPPGQKNFNNGSIGNIGNVQAARRFYNINI